MRRLILIFLCLLLPLPASAEIALTLSADRVAVGGLLEAAIKGAADGAMYRYTLLSGGEPVFEGDFVPRSSGFYRPRAAGDYVLRVTARTPDGREETAEGAFQAMGAPVCQATCDRETLCAGEPLTFFADAQGGVGGYTYVYSVWLENQRVLCTESTEPTLTYLPPRAGALRMEVTATDAQGGSATAVVRATVEPGPGISLSGAESVFYAQGGIQRWIVHAPGVWTARAEGDFIALEQTCGGEGDALFVRVSDGGGVSRRGSVTLVSGDSVLTFPVIQVQENGLEEDLRLSDSDGFLWVDGAERATWMDARGERRFSVSAPGPWTAETDADFLALVQEEGALTLRAEENPTDDVRVGRVMLRCGTRRVWIHVFQAPAARGAAVESVSLSAEGGAAWQDAVLATVETSADAEELTVRADGWRTPRVFSRDAAVPAGETLVWKVELPLQGAGEQTLLFSARNAAGAGRQQTARLTVTGEAPGFAADSAALISGETEARLTVRVTAATEEITLLDAAGETLGVWSAAQAEIDRCVPGDAAGRYADWTLTVDAARPPARVLLGGETVPVLARPAPEQPFVLYGQSDGWWQDKAYRHSNLQQSGCAIFALAHALQLLGYTGEEILPENLARTYAFCLLEGGTMNSTLVGHAGDDFGFKTRYELYENRADILQRMEQGAVFSFAVVNGHIALAAGASADGGKIRIIDSAPSATLERIQGARIYYQAADGAFVPVTDLAQVPGSRYFFETDAYGGLEYYLDADYVARRGARLIQPR